MGRWLRDATVPNATAVQPPIRHHKPRGSSSGGSAISPPSVNIRRRVSIATASTWPTVLFCATARRRKSTAWSHAVAWGNAARTWRGRSCRGVSCRRGRPAARAALAVSQNRTVPKRLKRRLKRPRGAPSAPRIPSIRAMEQDAGLPPDRMHPPVPSMSRLLDQPLVFPRVRGPAATRCCATPPVRPSGWTHSRTALDNPYATTVARNPRGARGKTSMGGDQRRGGTLAKSQLWATILTSTSDALCRLPAERTLRRRAGQHGSGILTRPRQAARRFFRHARVARPCRRPPMNSTEQERGFRNIPRACGQRRPTARADLAG